MLMSNKSLIPQLVLFLAVFSHELCGQEHSTTPVPKGEVIHFKFDDSKIFPGTHREGAVYIPSQYQGEQPAALYVNQDGIQYNAPEVFDQLIAANKMPITIGVFVRPGVVSANNPNSELDRYNRSYEYDSVNGNYARFLIEELLPYVETLKTNDGRPIRLTDDPNLRAIGGASSGAVCAFTVAWERPDSFRRVFSAIGTYVGLRGADRYVTLIRKYEPKPIKIFLQDGENDLDIYGGGWWLANQSLLGSLQFAGYDVRHEWGQGGHNAQDATRLFPDAMRWLWSDWQSPIKPGTSENASYTARFGPDSEWELVGEGYKFTEGPTSNPGGAVSFNDIPSEKTYQINAEGPPRVVVEQSNRANGQAFGPDKTHYAVAAGIGTLITYDDQWTSRTIAEGLTNCNDLIVAHNGNIYVTAPERGNPAKSHIWLVRPDGEKKIVDTGLNNPNGIALSPDQSLLYVAESRTHWVSSFQVQPDGTLSHKQRFFWLHAPDHLDEAGADGMAIDQEGMLYVATHLGIQICDPVGRVHAIIPVPSGRVSNVCFGGPNFDILYATCQDKVYRRKVAVKGITPWSPPFKPEKPRL